MSNQPEHMQHGDRVIVYPRRSETFTGKISNRRDAVSDLYIHVIPDDGTLAASYWPRDLVSRLPREEQPMQDTVEVSTSLLADLAYHYDKTSHMQAIPKAVVADLISLLPDPDAELRKQIRHLAANPEMEDSHIDRIIDAVRRNA